MQIKFSVLRSILAQNNNLDQENVKFIEAIEKGLNTKITNASLEDYDCDLKLIFIESGGSEGLFLENIDKLQEPYYLLTNGDNNSLAASLEILTWCNLNKKKGEILHGSIEYLQERINALASFNQVSKGLSALRLGVIGKPSDWLISSIPNSEFLKAKFGIDLVNIDIKELIETYEKTKVEEYNLNLPLEFDKLSLDKAKRMYVAIAKLKDKYHLEGLTIRCFDLLGTCNTTSCLGFAILNSQGVTSTCEGDIMSMLGMALVKKAFNLECFQANPARIDVVNRLITFAHCTIPFNMVDSYKLDTHFESKIGVGIKGELKLDEITILRISSDLKHYFVTSGKIIKNLNETNLCRTQIVVKCNGEIKSLLTNPCGNHHLIIYGDHVKALKTILSTYGLKSVED